MRFPFRSVFDRVFKLTMFAWSIHILKFFDFCGFSAEFFRSPKYRLFVNFIFTLHILLAVFLSVYVVKIKQYFYSKYAALDAFNQCTQYISLLLSYWIIFIESSVQRRNKRAFWQILNYIEKFSIQRTYLIAIIEHLLVSSVVNAVAIYWDIESRDMWIPYMILLYTNHLQTFFYIFHLEIIKSKFEQIRQELSVDNVDYTKEFLHAIRHKHQRICALIANVNDTYSISHLSTLMSQLYFVYSNLNWTYLHFSIHSAVYISSIYSLHPLGESHFAFNSASLLLIFSSSDVGTIHPSYYLLRIPRGI